MYSKEKKWSILGVTFAILAFLLTLIGIILTQVLPNSFAAKTVGVILVVVAGGFVIMVMVYTCIALKYNYKLFAVFNLGAPELRTDLKRRVLATDDPVPENLTALAAVASVTSQGNTLRYAPIELTTVTTETPADRVASVIAEMGDEDDDYHTAALDARSDDWLVVGVDPQSSTSNDTISASWKKGVTFRTPSRSPAISVVLDEPQSMPEYETIDRTVAEARSLGKASSIIEDAQSDITLDGENLADNGPLPAHYVGTNDERIEERLAERPSTPSDSSGSIQEAIYDAAEHGPEPDVEMVDLSRNTFTIDEDDSSSMRCSSLMGGIDEEVEDTSSHNKLARMRGLNLLRRKEVNRDFNTYENATAKRGRFLKKGVRRSGYEVNSEIASQFDSVSEIGEVDIPHERLSVAPSELSYQESLPESRVDSNLMF